MTTRYIFNTSGDYVAFIRGNHLFSKDCEWLGTIANGNEVFNTDGLHVGYLLDDDRIVRNKSESTSKRIPRQVKPIRPVRPVTPLRRLRKSKLPPPFEDVFDYSKVGKLLTNRNFPSFDHLLGAQIIANDGTLLGIINTNRYDPNSISNPYGQGNRYKSTSILNPYGRYGGKSLQPITVQSIHKHPAKNSCNKSSHWPPHKEQIRSEPVGPRRITCVAKNRSLGKGDLS